MSKYTGKNSSDRTVIVGVYESAPDALAEGERAEVRVDNKRNLQTTIATKVSTPVDAPTEAFSPFTGVTSIAAISTATTTVLSATGTQGIAYLYVNGGTMGNVTVYDNGAASGTVLKPTHTAFAGEFLCYRCPFRTGLTVVTAAATIITGHIELR